MSEDSKSIAGTDDDFDPKPAAKRAKRSTKETSKEPKEAGGGKKKASKSPNKSSKSPNKSITAKEKKKVARKPAKKKDDEESKQGFDDDDENYHPNISSDEDSEEDFDEEASDKPTKGKRGKSASAKKVTAKPSAKGKKGAVSRDEETETVLEYMKKQNRPYSLINIFDNLHGKIKKPQVQRILDSLASAGELQVKEFGKAKIYLLNQKNIPDVNQSELDEITKEVQELRTTHRQLTEEVKGLTAELKDLQNQPTDEQIDADIVKYENMIKEEESKLTVYESGNYPKISDEVMKKAEAKKDEYEKIFKSRKKMCMGLLGQISEIADMKMATLMEEIDLEM